METVRQRQPGRRRSEEERAGTEPDAKINQLGGEGAEAETGSQRQPGRRSSEEERAGTDAKISQEGKELERRLDTKDNQVAEVGEVKKRKELERSRTQKSVR
jgi:hypothetical protein